MADVDMPARSGTLPPLCPRPEHRRSVRAPNRVDNKRSRHRPLLKQADPATTAVEPVLPQAGPRRVSLASKAARARHRTIVGYVHMEMKDVLPSRRAVRLCQVHAVRSKPLVKKVGNSLRHRHDRGGIDFGDAPDVAGMHPGDHQRVPFGRLPRSRKATVRSSSATRYAAASPLTMRQKMHSSGTRTVWPVDLSRRCRVWGHGRARGNRRYAGAKRSIMREQVR